MPATTSTPTRARPADTVARGLSAMTNHRCATPCVDGPGSSRGTRSSHFTATRTPRPCLTVRSMAGTMPVERLADHTELDLIAITTRPFVTGEWRFGQPGGIQPCPRRST